MIDKKESTKKYQKKNISQYWRNVEDCQVFQNTKYVQMLTAHPKMTQFIISLHDMTDDILISGVEQKKSDLFKK